jgi:hypothetical protein
MGFGGEWEWGVVTPTVSGPVRDAGVKFSAEFGPVEQRSSI